MKTVDKVKSRLFTKWHLYMFSTGMMLWAVWFVAAIRAGIL